MLKVDVFIPKSRLFDQEELHRTNRRKKTDLFYVALPEGTILNQAGMVQDGR